MDENKKHFEKEDNLSCIDELNDLEKNEIFSKFVNQNPVDFSELEQYTDDEMSAIVMQEMDDSVFLHVPCPSDARPVHVPETLPTPSIVELAPNFKKPRKKKSKSALQESAILNPRRSNRIMMKHASATMSENMKRLDENMSEHKVKSSRAQARAQAAELATLEAETKDMSDGNTDLKELHKTMGNPIHLQDGKAFFTRLFARNEDFKLGIRWLKMIASDPTLASTPFPFHPRNFIALLPNLQGHQHLAEVPPGIVGSSSSAAGGNGALAQRTADDDHSTAARNNALAEASGSGKPADLAPTD